MQVVLFVVSDGMAIDLRSNNVSVFTLIEEVTAPVYPILIPRLTVTAIFAREGQEPDATFQMRASMGDKILFETPMDAEFQGRPRARNILEIGGIAIPGPGVLVFRLIQDGVTLAHWNVNFIRGSVEQPELALQGSGPSTAAVPQSTTTVLTPPLVTNHPTLTPTGNS